MISDFKKPAAYLVKLNPVAKGKASQGESSKESWITTSSAEDTSSVLASSKVSKGKTWVELHYYQKKDLQCT